MAARVAATGQDTTWDPDFLGFRRFYAHDDPFGNRLEFLQPADPSSLAR